MEHINIQILAYIYQKPRTFQQIQMKFDLSPAALSQLLSYKEMAGMYSASTDDYKTAKYSTTFKGETIAVSEIRRRHEVFFTRILSVISFLVSLAALALNYVNR